MQEEINQKTFVLTFKAAKVTGRLLKAVIRAAYQKLKITKDQKKYEQQHGTVKHGKQKLKDLQGQNQELSDIEITDDNIKSFEKYARKYNIDYCLKADKTQDPPQWYVFFKAKDKAMIDVALKEYAAESVATRKPSVREKLKATLKKVKMLPQPERTKQKTQNRSESL